MYNNKSIKKLYGIVLNNLQDNSHTAKKVVSIPNRIEKLSGCKISIYVHKYNPSKKNVSSPVIKNKKFYNSKTLKSRNSGKRGSKSCKIRRNCSKRRQVKPKKRKSCNLKHRSKTLRSNKKKLQNTYEGYYF
uniref:Uncharacterized protein n=1 Tax=Borely moumouvirus TaxID=2712067 RepID=A0A6G6ACA7_9VIRU